MDRTSTPGPADSPAGNAPAPTRRTVWHRRSWLPGLGRHTLPFTYAARCKRNPRAGLPFLVDNLGDDLLVILIAFVFLSALPLSVSAAIIAFHVSFWAIYEAGYVQNDAVALKHEVEPRLSPRAKAFQRIYSETAAWVWACVFGLIGAYFAAASGATGPCRYRDVDGQAASFNLPTADHADWLAVFATWLVALAVLRGVFHLYNHVDKISRIHLYLPLQLAKYAFPALFFALPAAGAALVFAQVMRRWLPYLQYRLTRQTKDLFPARLVRLVVFAALWLLLLPQNADLAYLSHGAVAAAVLAVRAGSQIRKAADSACWVGRDRWRSRDGAEAIRPAKAADGSQGGARQ